MTVVPVRRVVEGVVEQDEEELGQPVAVARHERRRLGRRGHRLAARPRARPRGPPPAARCRQRRRPGRPAGARGPARSRRTTRAGAGRRPGATAGRSRSTMSPTSGRPSSVDQPLALEDLGVGPDERGRRPQLVRRVGDEPALGVERPADRDQRIAGDQQRDQRRAEQADDRRPARSRRRGCSTGRRAGSGRSHPGRSRSARRRRRRHDRHGQQPDLDPAGVDRPQVAARARPPPRPPRRPAGPASATSRRVGEHAARSRRGRAGRCRPTPGRSRPTSVSSCACGSSPSSARDRTRRRWQRGPGRRPRRARAGRRTPSPRRSRRRAGRSSARVTTISRRRVVREQPGGRVGHPDAGQASARSV